MVLPAIRSIVRRREVLVRHSLTALLSLGLLGRDALLTMGS